MLNAYLNAEFLTSSFVHVQLERTPSLVEFIGRTVKTERMLLHWCYVPLCMRSFQMCRWTLTCNWKLFCCVNCDLRTCEQKKRNNIFVFILIYYSAYGNTIKIHLKKMKDNDYVKTAIRWRPATENREIAIEKFKTNVNITEITHF